MSLGQSLIPGAARVGGLVVAGARGVTRSAISYCKRHPSWCSTIGGVAAVEALISDGQLPLIKHRRAKGISGTEFKNFRRVARVINKYCAPVRKAMRSPAMKRSKASCP